MSGALRNSVPLFCSDEVCLHYFLFCLSEFLRHARDHYQQRCCSIPHHRQLHTLRPLSLLQGEQSLLQNHLGSAGIRLYSQKHFCQCSVLIRSTDCPFFFSTNLIILGVQRLLFVNAFFENTKFNIDSIYDVLMHIITKL